MRYKLKILHLLPFHFAFVLLLHPHFDGVRAQTSEFPSFNPGRFGDHCLYPSQCDSNSRLLCLGGYCRCSSESEMYDIVREGCALREGEQCSPPQFLFGENNPCVSNAVCSESTRICECASHAFPDRKGSCVRKKLYNESCSTSRECDDLKYLSCVDGACSCKLSTFDEYHQICLRKVGDVCSRTKECVSNSECSMSEGHQSKCACKQGYSETSAKTCGLSYGSPCGGEEVGKSCSDIYFACINGECRCKNPSYEVYDNHTGNCLSLVGGLCHLFLPSNKEHPLKLKNCVHNAECIRRDQSPLSQCECASGFVETLSGHCRLTHGSVCAIPGQNVQECAEPLVCKNMKCECQNENDIYDPSMKICRRIVGTICSNSDTNDCVINSECVQSRCKCSLGFLPTFRGECQSETPQNNFGISTGKPIYSLDIIPGSNHHGNYDHHYPHQLLSYNQ